MLEINRTKVINGSIGDPEAGMRGLICSSDRLEYRSVVCAGLASLTHDGLDGSRSLIESFLSSWLLLPD